MMEPEHITVYFRHKNWCVAASTSGMTATTWHPVAARRTLSYVGETRTRAETLYHRECSVRLGSSESASHTLLLLFPGRRASAKRKCQVRFTKRNAWNEAGTGSRCSFPHKSTEHLPGHVSGLQTWTTTCATAHHCCIRTRGIEGRSVHLTSQLVAESLLLGRLGHQGRHNGLESRHGRHGG
jgi:hypothetical protein